MNMIIYTFKVDKVMETQNQASQVIPRIGKLKKIALKALKQKGLKEHDVIQSKQR